MLLSFVLLTRELANQHSENLGTVLKYVIYNELSNTRNPNNMTLLGSLFQNNQEVAAKVCKSHCTLSLYASLERLSIVFTANSKHEFVPRDLEFSINFTYHLLFILTTWKSVHANSIHNNCSKLFLQQCICSFLISKISQLEFHICRKGDA